MNFQEFMLMTMLLQGVMCVLAMPFGAVIGYWWDQMPVTVHRAVFIVWPPFAVWPLLTQISGMYMGHPPGWFLAIFV